MRTPENVEPPVKARIARRVVWLLWAGIVGLSGAGFVLTLSNRSVINGGDLTVTVGMCLAAVGYGTVGTLIAARRQTQLRRGSLQPGRFPARFEDDRRARHLRPGIGAAQAQNMAAGFTYLLHKHAQRAAQDCPSLREKSVSPHVLRHTCAMMIYQATGDLRKVSLWLGHADMQATEVYVRADPMSDHSRIP